MAKKTNPEYNDYPLAEVCKTAEKLAKAGALVYQKWTCERCGERVTANNPNIFTELGHHEEKGDGKPCGCVTNIKVKGCNYVVHYTSDPPQTLEEIMKILDMK